MKITKIVNTHSHIDHAAGVQQAKEELGVDFYLHPEDEPVLEVLPEAAERFPQFGNVRVPKIDVYIEEGDDELIRVDFDFCPVCTEGIIEEIKDVNLLYHEATFLRVGLFTQQANFAQRYQARKFHALQKK